MEESQLSSFFNQTPIKKRKKPDLPTTKKLSPNKLSFPPLTKPLPTNNPSQQFCQSNDHPFIFPTFIRPQNIRDMQMRRPDHPDYDPSTLHIPPTQKLTPAMAQYWQFKKHHFDKIVLFKIRRFYQCYNYDAIAAQKLLNLRWVGNDFKRINVGFPQTSLQKNSKILVNAGYQVMLVQQTQATSKDGKTVQREISGVLTKSTLGAIKEEDDYDAKYLMSVIQIQKKYGVCLVDCSTSKFIVGECDFSRLKTLLVQTRPSEVIHHPLFLDSYTYKTIKTGAIPPIIRSIKKVECWSTINIHNRITSQIPEVLLDMSQATVWKALAGCMSYLEDLMLLEKIWPIAQFESLYQSTIAQKLILDDRALESLQIVQAKLNKKLTAEGSLLEFLDQTSTKWGKRLLKKWVLTPLVSVPAIYERQVAIEELKFRKDVTDRVGKVLKKQPDLQRLFSRISAFAIKTQSKAVYYQDMTKKKLLEFDRLMSSFSELQYLVQNFQDLQIQSPKLLQILNFQPKGKFPEMVKYLRWFQQKIQWIDGKPRPVPGVWPPYDQKKEQKKIIEQSLQEVLIIQKEKFMNHPEIKFVHIKYRYQLEVPQHCLKIHKKPADYQQTSAKKGYQRFYTPQIKILTDQLSITEYYLKLEMKPFAQWLFSQFYLQKTRWQTAIQLTAQLDCLTSLAKSSRNAPYDSCLPTFTDNPRHFQATGLVHPVLANRKSTFVKNDVFINNSSPMVVLTGPNMGGKSTILRQVALATIMAQIGTFAPASSLILSVTDKIFTRMGAADCLEEGKSTFFIQVEEAAKIAVEGTQNSLALIDEFGRGTSTSDGASLALAFLRKLSEEIQPRILFTTHYHMISSEIESIPGVRMMHMNSLVERSEKVSFLYQLVDGVCGNSYALNVAGLAGLPVEVIEQARSLLKNEGGSV